MEWNGKKLPGQNLKKDQMQITGTALVTIVTPYYNAGAYLEQTFYSVVNQTFPWFAWLIVDDGSDQEKDIAVLARSAEMDHRVSVLHQKHQGLANARNTGFWHAGTDIVVILEAGSLLLPQYLEYTYFGLYFHKDAAWCYTDAAVFGTREYLWRRPWNAKRLLRQNFLPSAAAVRKQAFEQAGGYQALGLADEDWYFWLKLLACHRYPVHLKGFLFWQRYRPDGRLPADDAGHAKWLPTNDAGCAQRHAGMKIIRKAAARADDSVRAVEYPVTRAHSPYYRPKAMEGWNGYRVRRQGTKGRILMLVPWLVMGGADKWNLDLAAGLTGRGFMVSIITTVPSENEWQGYFQKYTDEIFHLPDFVAPEHYAEFVSYYIRTREIDLFFVSNSYRGYYMLPLLRKQFPDLCIVDYVHMEEWYWKAGGFARLSGMFGSVLEKTYVCNSATREVMLQCFKRNPESVDTMYVGVDEWRFHPQKVKKGRLYQKLGISKKRPVILFPCRICAQKRPFLMLDIAQKVCKERPDVVFAAVGDGPQKRALEREIIRRRMKKHVVCTGRSEHIEQCYQDAKVTLICSVKEGLSLTAYESCAMGTPVVSSDVGGQKDLIDDTVGKLIRMRQDESGDFDKRNYDPQEVKEYADAVLKLLSDPEYYQRCRKNCREKILQGFTAKHVLDNMERELLRMVKDEGRVEKRREKALEMQQAGFLPEELYTVEMAEEERSLGGSAVLSVVEKMAAGLLPQGSGRREMAARMYAKWRRTGHD